MRSHLFRASLAPSLLAFGLFSGCVPLSETDLGARPEANLPVDANSVGPELVDGEMVETDFGDEMPPPADGSARVKTPAQTRTTSGPTTSGSMDFEEPDATTEVRVAVLARKMPTTQVASTESIPSDSMLQDPASEPDTGEIEATKQLPLAVDTDETHDSFEPNAEPSLEPSLEPSEEPILGGWYVQISAETDAVTADSLRDRLTQLGLNAQLQRALVNGTRYVRVLVGPYSSKAEAFAARAEVAPYQLGTGKPFVKHVR